MKRATTVAAVRREYNRVRDNPAELQRLMQRWAREALPRNLDQYRGIVMATGDDGVTRIGQAGEIVARFRWDDLRQSLTPEHYDLVALLYQLLQEHAAFALAVQSVLEAEATAVKGRSNAGTKTGEARARDAKTRLAKIKAAVKQIRKTDKDIKQRALASTLHDRGHGGVEALIRILRRHKL